MGEYIEREKNKIKLLQKRLIHQAGLSLSSADSGKTQLKAENERTRLSEEYLAIISGVYNKIKKNTDENPGREEFFQMTAIIDFCKKSLDIIEVLNKLPLHKRRFKDKHAGKIMHLNSKEYDELFNPGRISEPLKNIKKIFERNPKNSKNETILIRVNEDEMNEAKKLAREETNGNVSLFFRRLMVKSAEKKEQKIYNIIAEHERVIAEMNKMFPKTKRQK